jgi:hypothetical protein
VPEELLVSASVLVLVVAAWPALLLLTLLFIQG